MQKINTKKENLTFRMLYVIAIFMIVDGHLGSYDYLSLNNLMRYQNFHIALFMFASGFFLNLTYSYQEFIKRKFMHLIVPLYLWTFIYGLLCTYLNKYHGFHIGAPLTAYNLLIAPLTDGHQFIYNMASWFLVPLFFVQLISFIILKPVTNTRFIPLIYFILALILGCFCLNVAPQNHGDRNFILFISRILYFLPSFAFGYLYKTTLQKYDRLKTPLYLFLLLSIVWGLTTAFPNYNHIPSWLDYIGTFSVVIYTINFVCILFWLRIAKICAPILTKSRCLYNISTHTFPIMMHHFLGFMLLKSFFAFIGANGFNTAEFKTNIWYNYFPNNNENIAILYLFITILIALLIGFTLDKIYAKINSNFRL